MPTGKKISELPPLGGAPSEVLGLETIGTRGGQSWRVPLGDIVGRVLRRGGSLLNLTAMTGEQYATPEAAFGALADVVSAGRELPADMPSLADGVALTYRDGGAWRMFQYQPLYSADPRPDRLRDAAGWSELAVTADISAKADKAYVDALLAGKADKAETSLLERRVSVALDKDGRLQPAALGEGLVRAENLEAGLAARLSLPPAVSNLDALRPRTKEEGPWTLAEAVAYLAEAAMPKVATGAMLTYHDGARPRLYQYQGATAANLPNPNYWKEMDPAQAARVDTIDAGAW